MRFGALPHSIKVSRDKVQELDAHYNLRITIFDLNFDTQCFPSFVSDVSRLSPPPPHTLSFFSLSSDLGPYISLMQFLLPSCPPLLLLFYLIHSDSESKKWPWACPVNWSVNYHFCSGFYFSHNTKVTESQQWKERTSLVLFSPGRTSTCMSLCVYVCVLLIYKVN